MNKNLSKLYTIFVVISLVLLTACQASDDQKQETSENATCFYSFKAQEKSAITSLFEDEKIREALSNALSNLKDRQEIEQEPTEPVETQEKVDLELPGGEFIIEYNQNSNGELSVLTLKDGILKYWLNGTIVCKKTIPIPAKTSFGSSFNDIIGNPYISEDGKLVLIQSYTTLEGELKLDYTIFAKHCSKIVPVLAYDSWVFQNNEGKYGLAFYRDDAYYWYPYAGFRFNTVEDSNFSLPKPTIIWLNESTVKSVSFGSWGSSSYGYQDVSAISARLDVESYGELDISNVLGSFKPIEVDGKFFDLLHQKFEPQEYTERLCLVIQALNEYKQKS